MFQVTLFLYQLVGALCANIIPLAMVLGLVWIVVKMIKKFILSIIR